MADRNLSRPPRRTLSRYRFVKKLSSLFDLTLGPLAIVTLLLVIVDLVLNLSPPWSTLVFAGQMATWATFLVAFALELWLAPRRLQYLRKNWLIVIALAIPALRIFRAAQAFRFLRSVRVVRSLSVARSLTTLNRGVRAIRDFLGFSQMAFLTTLMLAVWLISGCLVFYLEQGTNSGLNNLGMALWWAASLLTTVNIGAEPSSVEARVVAFLLRLFGIAIIGYFTARLAAYFLKDGRTETETASETDRSSQMEALRHEIEALRSDLQAARSAGRPGEDKTRNS